MVLVVVMFCDCDGEVAAHKLSFNTRQAWEEVCQINLRTNLLRYFSSDTIFSSSLLVLSGLIVALKG